MSYDMEARYEYRRGVCRVPARVRVKLALEERAQARPPQGKSRERFDAYWSQRWKDAAREAG